MVNTYITFLDSLTRFQRGALDQSFTNDETARSNPDIETAWRSLTEAWRALNEGTLRNSGAKNITKGCRAISGVFDFRGDPHTLTIFQDNPDAGYKSVRAVQITNSDETMSSYFSCPSVTSKWTESANTYLKV